MEAGLLVIGHKIDLVDRHLQDACMDIKNLNLRTTIVETRLQERSLAVCLPHRAADEPLPVKVKRGRPRKLI